MKRTVKIGNITLGDGNVYIQSMLKKPAADIDGNIAQALELQRVGCDIIRAAVPEKEDARLIYALKERLGTPVVADIHFDYKIALEAIAAGADKIRLNPGNLAPDKREIVANKCGEKNIPIRIGINAGSLEKELLKQYGVCAEALAESALKSAKLLEALGFRDIVLSVKASNVKMCIDAYRLLHKKCDYPLHIGVTEAGTKRLGLLKSAVGIGALLSDGIGDTIRISLTDEPVEEVLAAWDLLAATGTRKVTEIISCPTCGRTKTDIIGLVKKAESLIYDMTFTKPLKIAVMGCEVNGPGEAREADIGVAFGKKGEGVLFKKGEIIGKVSGENALRALKNEIEGLL